MTTKKLLCIWIATVSLCVYNVTFAAWDCVEVLDPAQFATNALWVLDTNSTKRVFFTDSGLQTVVKSLNTYCCDSGDTSWEACADRQIYKNPTYKSPNLIDHFKFVFDLQLQGKRISEDGNEVTCDAYDVSCEPQIYTEFDLPSPMVCFRNGADVDNGWDERCQTVYDVWSGVDTLTASTDISSPAQVRWLYQKFRSSDEYLVPPKASTLTSAQAVQDLRYMQLWWLMCQEVAIIHNQLLTTSNSSWNILQQCKKYVRDGLQKHARYTKSLSFNAQEQQMASINSTVRDYMYTTFDALMDNIASLVSKWYQAMSEMWTEYTTVCE